MGTKHPAVRLAILLFAVLFAFLFVSKLFGLVTAAAFSLVRFVIPLLIVIAIVMFFVGRTSGARKV